MSSVRPVSSTEFDRSPQDGPAAVVRAVLAACTDADGSSPLDEAALLALRHGLGDSSLWLAGDRGLAWRHDGSLEVAVDPAARGQGLGAALVAAAVDDPGELSAWSHGNHPAAAALASRHGFDRVRDLWVMRRSLAGLPEEGPPAEGVEIRAFEVGRDEAAFLALNAESFARHPEQGGLDRAGLDERIAEPWFDPAGFFLAWRGADLVGFHWTKVHDDQPPGGEVYVVAVSPHAQGGGLGRRLTLTGLQHLASRGLAEVLLYVEADNAPAVAVYSRLGFTHAGRDTHVQYARR